MSWATTIGMIEVCIWARKEELKEELTGQDDPAAKKFLSMCDDHMDELLNDPDEKVRGYVAMCRYKPEVLAYDRSPYVRLQVAKSGLCSGELINDDDPEVRRIAIEMNAKYERKNTSKSAEKQNERNQQ